MTIREEDLRLLGYAGVDSGTVWIGDPCYIVGKDGGGHESWIRFSDKLFPPESGGGGLPSVEVEGGIHVGTRHGDGAYPVYGVYDKSDGPRRRPRGVFIDFDNVLDEYE